MEDVLKIHHCNIGYWFFLKGKGLHRVTSGEKLDKGKISLEKGTLKNFYFRAGM